MYLTCVGPALDDLNVVGLAEHLAVLQGELLSRRQLALTAVTGEAGEVVHVVLGPPHPVRRLDTPQTLGALGPELSVRGQRELVRVGIGNQRGKGGVYTLSCVVMVRLVCMCD